MIYTFNLKRAAGKTEVIKRFYLPFAAALGVGYSIYIRALLLLLLLLVLQRIYIYNSVEIKAPEGKNFNLHRHYHSPLYSREILQIDRLTLYYYCQFFYIFLINNNLECVTIVYHYSQKQIIRHTRDNATSEGYTLRIYRIYSRGERDYHLP